MKTETLNTQKVKNGASYVMLFLSAVGLGFSVMSYFTSSEINWGIILPLFIVSITVFLKNIISLKNK